MSPAFTQEVRLLSDLRTSDVAAPAIDDAGSIVYAASSTGQFGTNPRRAWQVVEWAAATGAGSQVSSFVEGVFSDAVSVSDAGDWIAFISRGNLTGQNHDGSLELFVMGPSGAGLAQITSDSALSGGSVGFPSISGSGNRVVFVADTDLLGTNPSRVNQVFVVNRDGTGVRQLTLSVAAASADSLHSSISDDGQRVVFASYSDLTGGNPDGTREIFAVNADGTGLRQLTAGTIGDKQNPTIAGDGSRVAFDSFANPLGTNPDRVGQIFVVDWAGTNLRQLTFVGANSWAEQPSITDDGQTIVYESDESTATVNPDANTEIWKIRADGSQKTLLTETPGGQGGCHAPVVSGSGSRIAFLSSGEFPGGDNVDRSSELLAMDGSGTGLVQLSTTAFGRHRDPDITSDGSRIVFSATRDLGSASRQYYQIHRIQADGSGLFQVTRLTDGDAIYPGLTSDGNTLVFMSWADPVGQNPDHGAEIFSVGADGLSLRQLTSDTGSGFWSVQPVVSANGAWVVFQSAGNLGGLNPLHSPELFRVKPDGTGLARLTLDSSSAYKLPRVDDNGTWVVYQSDGNPTGQNADGSMELFRIKTDGTGLQQVTASSTHDAVEPDVSGAGGRIVYASPGDPLGTNADHNYEIFAYDPGTGTRRQLTSTLSGSNVWPRISGDGAWVYFQSSAPFFESLPGGPNELYRVAVATGVLERVDGVWKPPATVAGFTGSWKDHPYTCAPDYDGDRLAFATDGEWAPGNEDWSDEIWLTDQAARAGIEVGKASPTVVSWKVEPQPRRYDVIRGEIANLHAGAGAAVDLGAVACVEDDSTNNDTVGSEDPDTPLPGHGFFYLYRGSQGLLDGPGSYGRGTSGGERTPSSGGCSG